jgi:NTE family protein
VRSPYQRLASICGLWLVLSICFSRCTVAQSLSQALLTTTLPRRPTVALVLSGGGARGLAQIGVLKALHEARIPVDYVVGTSMGAIVGGLYAAGYTPDELDSLLTTLHWKDLVGTANERDRSGEFVERRTELDQSLLTLTFKDGRFALPEAASGGYKFTSTLRRFVWNALYQANGDFDNLKIPFRAVATDLVSGSSVALRSGDLVTAIRASATIPLQFKPVRRDSMLLVDGGLLANIPVEAARAFQPDIIIAVDNTSALLSREELNSPWNVADQVVTLMMKSRAEQERRTADVVIEPLRPNLQGHSNTDFTNLQGLVRSGEASTRAALPKIRQVLSECAAPIALDKPNATVGKHGVESPVSRTVGTAQNAQNLVEQLTATVEYVRCEGVAERYRVAIDSICATVFGCPNTSELHTTLAEAITRWYKQRGHSLAQARVYASAALPHLLFVVCQEGLVSEVRYKATHSSDGQSQPSPLRRTRAELLRQEFFMQDNEPFNADRVLESWRRVMASDWFNDVSVTASAQPFPPSFERSVEQLRQPQGVVVNIRADEKPTLLIRLGGRIDNERNMQLGLDVIEDDILQTGLRAAFRAAGGARNVLGQITFVAPRIFNSSWQFDVRGYASRTNIYNYEDRKVSLPNFERVRTGESAIDRLGIKAAVVQQIGRTGFLAAEFRYELQQMFDFLDVQRQPYRPINTVKLGARFDTQDRIDFPTNGRILELSYEFPLIRLAQGLGFSRAVLRHTGASSIGSGNDASNHVLCHSLNFGFADLTLPPAEFFSLGGEDVFFGMREDEMRGSQIASFSLEYRYRLPWRLFNLDAYASVRYDAGYIWQALSLVRFADIRQGVGFSAALDTPFGPARVSVGRSFYVLPQVVPVWGPTMLYFSIGIRI